MPRQMARRSDPAELVGALMSWFIWRDADTKMRTMKAKKSLIVAAMLTTAGTFVGSATAVAASFGFYAGPALDPTLPLENEFAIWNRFTPNQPIFNREIGDENARFSLIQMGLFGGPQKLTAEQIAKYDQLVEAVIAHDRERVDAITKTFTFLDWTGLEVGITRVPEEKKQQMLWAVKTYPQTLHDEARPTFFRYLRGVEPLPPPSVVREAAPAPPPA